MDPARYFDHAATTPVDPLVLKEMLPFFSEDFGNANSIHAFGQKARAAVELARARVADALGAEDPSQIVFTSGATEGNNWILSNFPDAVVSPFEHTSIRHPAQEMGLRTLANEDARLLPLEMLSPLLSVMRVNNETGTIWDPSQLRGKAELVHSDLTQAVGKIPTSVEALDIATFSAHKFYGPKGVGAVFLREERLRPLLTGGEQEFDMRAGTLNVPGIVGMGVAIARATEQIASEYHRVCLMRDLVIETLDKVSDVRINGDTNRSPYIVSVSFLGLEGETLVLAADHSGYAISSGAACSAGSTDPSPVLRHMGVPDLWNRGTVRISFGRANTTDSAAGLAACLQQSVKKLRTMT